MKIGILGGAFDPPHVGHLILAEFAWQQYHLDRVIFMPYSRSSNKSPSASAKDRLEMVHRAVEGIKYFAVDDREIRRGGVTYTIDTVQEMLKADSSLEIFWIVGQDAIEGLSSWKEWEKLVKLIKFIVAKRNCGSLSKKDFILELEMPVIEVSSSLIRQRLKRGKTIRFLVPEGVYDYIVKKGLYLDGITNEHI